MSDKEKTHIVPVNDIFEHTTEFYSCKCIPVINEEDDIVIHNAFDSRELNEFKEEVKPLLVQAIEFIDSMNDGGDWKEEWVEKVDKILSDIK
jgi:hypothetical protein